MLGSTIAIQLVLILSIHGVSFVENKLCIQKSNSPVTMVTHGMMSFSPVTVVTHGMMSFSPVTVVTHGMMSFSPVTVVTYGMMSFSMY